MSNTVRYDADRSRVAQAIPARHASGRAANQRHGSTRVATRHDVEQLAGADVDDLGRPPLMPVRALAGEQGLVQPDRGDGPEAVRVVDQRGAVDDDGVHHRVPVTAEIGGDLG